MPLAEAEPADARRQSLELDLLRRQVEPSLEILVLREQSADLGIGACYVLGITGQRHPAERAFADAEERTHISGHEARIGEGVLQAGVLRFLADVVAIVDARDAQLLEADDGAHMLRDGLPGGERNLFWFCLSQ